MDSFACGFETRNRVAGQPVSHFLTPPAQKASRCSFVKLGPSRVALSTLNTITQPFPMFCLCLFLFYYSYFIHQNIYATFTLPPKPRCFPPYPYRLMSVCHGFLSVAFMRRPISPRTLLPLMLAARIATPLTTPSASPSNSYS